MKRKICRILLTLVVVLSFSLVTVVPAAAYPSPSPIALGSAANFAVIAAAGITNAAFATAITGDMGTSPTVSVTGFPPGTYTGTLYTGDGASIAGLARADAGTAYQAAKTAGTAPDKTVSGNLVTMGDGGTATFSPGIYHSTSSLSIDGSAITLDAAGDANAVWIFDMESTLTTTAGGDVLLANSADAKNVFWRVGSSATLGAAIFKGTILADTSITLGTTAIDVAGRLLAGCVTVSGAVAFNTAAHTVVRPLSDTTAPTVISTVPANAATGVAINSAMTATFSEVMKPSTITTATFTLAQGATPVTGLVTYAGVTATFTPAANLAPGTVYTATITTGAQDLAGNPLAVNKVWTFTTAAAAPAPGGPAVGGEAYPINKAYVLLPWLILALIIVTGGSVLVLRRRRSR